MSEKAEDTVLLQAGDYALVQGLRPKHAREGEEIVTRDVLVLLIRKGTQEAEVPKNVYAIVSEQVGYQVPAADVLAEVWEDFSPNIEAQKGD